mgnify:CR=1 FL=1
MSGERLQARTAGLQGTKEPREERLPSGIKEECSLTLPVGISFLFLLPLLFWACVNQIFLVFHFIFSTDFLFVPFLVTFLVVILKITFLKKLARCNFPSSPVVRTPLIQCSRCEFDPGSGNEDSPLAGWHSRKRKKCLKKKKSWQE